MKDFYCDVWKWKDRLTVFPRCGTYRVSYILNLPVEASGGYRGLSKAIEAARRAGAVVGDIQVGDDRIVLPDNLPISAALGIPDRRTFVREAVGCLVYKGLIDDFPELELKGLVGVPRERTHWAVEKRRLPYNAPAKEVLAEVRDLLEKMESLRGKPVKYLVAR